MHVSHHQNPFPPPPVGITLGIGANQTYIPGFDRLDIIESFDSNSTGDSTAFTDFSILAQIAGPENFDMMLNFENNALTPVSHLTFQLSDGTYAFDTTTTFAQNVFVVAVDYGPDETIMEINCDPVDTNDCRLDKYFKAAPLGDEIKELWLEFQFVMMRSDTSATPEFNIPIEGILYFME